MHSNLATLRRYRPRILTLATLAIVLALLVLSNLSFDKGSNWNFAHKSYGWPLIWHRFVYIEYGETIGWHWSASRLAINLAMWLLMLAATASVCEWLSSHYRPRFRWSLRGMLAAMGLLAASCAWFAAASERAGLQDQIIETLVLPEPAVGVERRGPQWLDLFGVDRFRRRIVFARLDAEILDLEAADVEKLLGQLAELRQLRRLVLRLKQLTPAVSKALSRLPQLESLSISAGSPSPGDERISHECLTAIGKMTQLEGLELSGVVIRSESLLCLGGLSNLRSLAITGAYTPDSEASLLSHLPVLPRLDVLDLTRSKLCRDDCSRLAALPRLKSLRLGGDRLCGEALTELSQLESLEEVEIGNSRHENVDLAAKLARLLTIDRLRVVQIHDMEPDVQAPFGSIGEREMDLDDRETLHVRDGDIERVRQALDALREKKPGIVIDVRWHSRMAWGEEESAWSSYDRAPIHDPTWLPASDVPWMTAAQRADFDKKGGWARFDAAGWGNERANSTSF